MTAGYDQQIMQHTDGFEYLWCAGASAWVVQNDPSCNAECPFSSPTPNINPDTKDNMFADKPARDDMFADRPTKRSMSRQKRKINRLQELANIKKKK